MLRLIRYSFLFIFFFTNQTFAQLIIQGIINDAKNKTPIENVNVYIKNLNIGTASTIDGTFSVSIENSQKVSIVFSHVSYEKISMDTIPNIDLLIEMVPKSLKLKDIVVTSMRSEYNLNDVPVFTEVINRKDISESGAITVAELIEQRGGVTKSYNFDGSFNYKLLGMDSKYVLILKDGKPITGRFNDKIDLDQLIVSNIEKIEIIKGPGSALYGTEAMGGVVNIITRQENNNLTHIMYRSTFYNNYLDNIIKPPDGHVLSLDISRSIGPIKINSTIMGQTLANSNDYSQLGKDLINKINLDSRIFMKSKNKGHSFIVGLNYFGRIDSTKIETSTGTKVATNSTNVNRKQISFDHRIPLSKRLLFTQVLNLSDYHRLYKQNGLDESFYRNETTSEGLLSYEANIILKSQNKNNFSGGIEYSKPKYQNERIKDGIHERTLKGIYLQSDLKVTNSTTLINGLRFDQYGDTKVYSPRLALLFKSGNNLKFRTSYGEGFRVPSFLETLIDWYNIDHGYKVEGNPELKSEKSKGLNFNIEYSNNKNIRWNILLYGNRFSNKIITEQNKNISLNEAIIFRYKNISNATYSGLEFLATYLLGQNLSLKFNFNIRNNYDDIGDEIPNTIPISIGFRLSHYIKKYKTKLIIISSTNLRKETKQYTIIDIRINKKINHNFNLITGIKNIGDYTNSDLGPYLGRTMYVEIAR